MNFQEAATIAKQNPGSTLTRDHSGCFIVIRKDGTIIQSVTQKKTSRSTDQLLEEISSLRRECETLKNKITYQKLEIDQLESKVASLTTKFSRVSKSELDRIKEEDKQEDAKQKESERQPLTLYWLSRAAVSS